MENQSSYNHFNGNYADDFFFKNSALSVNNNILTEPYQNLKIHPVNNNVAFGNINTETLHDNRALDCFQVKMDDSSLTSYSEIVLSDLLRINSEMYENSLVNNVDVYGSEDQKLLFINDKNSVSIPNGNEEANMYCSIGNNRLETTAGPDFLKFNPHPGLVQDEMMFPAYQDNKINSENSVLNFSFEPQFNVCSYNNMEKCNTTLCEDITNSNFDNRPYNYSYLAVNRNLESEFNSVMNCPRFSEVDKNQYLNDSDSLDELNGTFSTMLNDCSQTCQIGPETRRGNEFFQDSELDLKTARVKVDHSYHLPLLTCKPRSNGKKSPGVKRVAVKRVPQKRVHTPEKNYGTSFGQKANYLYGKKFEFSKGFSAFSVKNGNHFTDSKAFDNNHSVSSEMQSNHIENRNNSITESINSKPLISDYSSTYHFGNLNSFYKTNFGDPGNGSNLKGNGLIDPVDLVDSRITSQTKNSILANRLICKVSEKTDMNVMSTNQRKSQVVTKDLFEPTNFMFTEHFTDLKVSDKTNRAGLKVEFNVEGSKPFYAKDSFDSINSSPINNFTHFKISEKNNCSNLKFVPKCKEIKQADTTNLVNSGKSKPACPAIATKISNCNNFSDLKVKSNSEHYKQNSFKVPLNSATSTNVNDFTKDCDKIERKFKSNFEATKQNVVPNSFDSRMSILKDRSTHQFLNLKDTEKNHEITPKGNQINKCTKEVKCNIDQNTLKNIKIKSDKQEDKCLNLKLTEKIGNTKSTVKIENNIDGSLKPDTQDVTNAQDKCSKIVVGESLSKNSQGTNYNVAMPPLAENNYECHECGAKLKTQNSLFVHKKIHLSKLIMAVNLLKRKRMAEKNREEAEENEAKRRRMSLRGEVTNTDTKETVTRASKRIQKMDESKKQVKKNVKTTKVKISKVNKSVEVKKGEKEKEDRSMKTKKITVVKTKKNESVEKKTEAKSVNTQEVNENKSKTEPVQPKLNCRSINATAIGNSGNMRKFVCPDCKAGFKRNDHLKRHQLLHAEKSFECNDCGLKFYRGDKLKIHKLKHHVSVHQKNTRSTLEKPKLPKRNVECEKCGFHFLQSVTAKDRSGLSGRRNSCCISCGAKLKEEN